MLEDKILQLTEVKQWNRGSLEPVRIIGQRQGTLPNQFMRIFKETTTYFKEKHWIATFEQYLSTLGKVRLHLHGLGQ